MLENDFVKSLLAEVNSINSFVNLTPQKEASEMLF